MKRSKASKKSLAEKALRAAIAEETSELQAQLRQRDAEILRLHGLLDLIVQTATRAESQIRPVVQPSAEAPRIEEPPIPEGPSVPLDGDDDLGEGRWA